MLWRASFVICLVLICANAFREVAGVSFGSSQPSRSSHEGMSYAQPYRRLLVKKPDNVTVVHNEDGLQAFRTIREPQPVALCMIVRDEDVREWVQHHHSIGVGHMYIYDDQSSPPLLGSLMDDISIGAVHYTYTLRKGLQGIQLDTYTQCLREHGHKHEWMGFLDADEYFVLHEKSYRHDIHGFLNLYRDYGGLGVNWRMYGSNQHLYWPHGLGARASAASTLKTYTSCTPKDWEPNLHIKSIVQPKHTLSAANPHFFTYKEGYYAVAVDFTKVEQAWTSTVQVDKISCNHYVTKSWSEWGQKLTRGNADEIRKQGFGGFIGVENIANEYCPYTPQ